MFVCLFVCHRLPRSCSSYVLQMRSSRFAKLCCECFVHKMHGMWSNMLFLVYVFLDKFGIASVFVYRAVCSRCICEGLPFLSHSRRCFFICFGVRSFGPSALGCTPGSQMWPSAMHGVVPLWIASLVRWLRVRPIYRAFSSMKWGNCTRNCPWLRTCLPRCYDWAKAYLAQ